MTQLQAEARPGCRQLWEASRTQSVLLRTEGPSASAPPLETSVLFADLPSFPPSSFALQPLVGMSMAELQKPFSPLPGTPLKRKAGAHLDDLVNLDRRMSKAIFFKKCADGVDSFMELIQEDFVGLEEVLDEFIQKMPWGLEERCWLGEGRTPP